MTAKTILRCFIQYILKCNFFLSFSSLLFCLLPNTPQCVYVYIKFIPTWMLIISLPRAPELNSCPISFQLITPNAQLSFSMRMDRQTVAKSLKDYWESKDAESVLLTHSNYLTPKIMTERSTQKWHVVWFHEYVILEQFMCRLWWQGADASLAHLQTG